MQRISRLIVLLMFLCAIAVETIVPIIALRWIQLPFPGLLLEQTLVVSGIPGEGWYTDQVPERQMHLTAIDGEMVTDSRDIGRVLRDRSPGETVSLSLAPRGGGPEQTLQVTLQRFPLASWFALFWLPYVLGLSYLIIGGWVFWHRSYQRAGQIFALVCIFTALITGSFFDMNTTHALSWLWTAAVPLAAAAMTHLGLVFPEENPVVRRWPASRFVPYVLAVPPTVVAEIQLYNVSDPWAYIRPWQWGQMGLGVSLVLFVALLVYARARTVSQVVRQQVHLILVGGSLAFAPLAFYLTVGVILDLPFQTALYMPTLILFPLFVAYAILRYKLLGMDLVISRGLAYVILGVSVMGAYVLALTVLGRTLGLQVGDNPLFLALLGMILIFALNPLREGSERLVDRLLHRRRVDYGQVLQDYSRELAGTPLDLPTLLARLMARVEPVAHSAPTLVFLYDSLLDRYILRQASRFVQPEDREISFAVDGALARRLAGDEGPLYLLAQPDQLPAGEESRELEALGLALFLPLRGKAKLAGRERLEGWVALGPRLSGEPYTPEDLSFLSALVDQTTIAIENARLLGDLEQQVVRLDVLRQISEAVDLRQELADLLALIYRQTSRVLAVDNFYVALYDPVRQEFEMAFYVEEGELREPLSSSWPLGTGLTSHIVRSGQPIATDDYLTECRRLGIEHAGRPAKAWMGVPLKSGPAGQVLGVLNVSSFRHDYRYTDEQVQLMRAIADQAAMAIDRMRLYREMEVRAAELATLNEVSRTINSTLDLPSVLDLIMNKVVELLDVEAGSLLLVDEEVGDLTFEVVLGAPDSHLLIGRRHAAGQGIVGQVVTSGQAQIVNDVQADPHWDRDVDREIGFVSRRIMAVPMISRDRVIGVIEVINHRNGGPFEEEEAALLTNFAAQAAVAIENARLYTQTDLALARRVEELSTMQRIDRELNAALDFDRVIELTLDWALKATDAPVGVIAYYDEALDGLLLLASRGYPAELERYREEPWPLDRGIVGRVVRSGEPALVQDVAADEDYRPVQPSSHSQLSVPIRREGRVIGVLTVEHPEADVFDEDALIFLQRLADHAAIAIENARLHDETQQRLQGQVALREAAQAISSALEREIVLSRIAEQLCSVVDATSVYILDCEPEIGSTTVIAEHISPNARPEESESDLGITYVELDPDFYDTLQAGGYDVSYIDDPDLDDFEREHMLRYGAKTVLYIPFQIRGRLTGFAEVWESRRLRRFAPDEIALCQGIGQQAAIAMENARLYQESRRRAEDMSLLYEASLTVSSHLSLSQVLETIHLQIREVWDPPVFFIALYDAAEDALDFVIYVDRGQRLTPFRQSLAEKSGFSAWIVRNRRPILIDDWEQQAASSEVQGIPLGDVTRSWLGVPLVVGDRMVGVMSVQDYEPDAYGRDHEQFLSTIAGQVAIAIENARLYQQAEEMAEENEHLYQEAQQRLGEVSLLYDTSSAVSRTLDLDQVLNTTVEQITAALAADGCALWIWDREEAALVTQLDYVTDPGLRQPGRPGTVYPLVDYPTPSQVLTERQPLPAQAGDETADPATRAWLAERQVRSALLVPIVVRDRAIGLLELSQAEKDREFSANEIRLCQTLANQAAAAIENARLYEGVKEADQAKSEFIDFVAHELKQPMTAMQGYAKLLTMGVGGQLNDQQKQFVQVINSNVERMGKLVNDLLEISRLEAGRTKLSLAPVNLQEILEETLTYTRTEIEARHQVVEIDTPEDLPPVLGDRERLIQILTNLVSNAYKYTPEGGHIRIAVNGQDRPEVPPGHVLVSVSDDGIGMSAQDLLRLEEKFFRADNDLVREQPGTGLGVSITRNLVALHGGEFLVESEPGLGSTFGFTLPIAADGNESPFDTPG
ncbi:MAG: GAF domain-containing protein [Anaerolineae bacterium]